MEIHVGQHVYLFDDQTSGTYEWPDRPGERHPHHNSEGDYVVTEIDGECVTLERWNGDKYRTGMNQLWAVVMPEQLDPVRIAHLHTRHNRREIERGNACACGYCRTTFPRDQIERWAGAAEDTALCPKCGIDAVISYRCGFDLTPDFLQQIHTRFFAAPPMEQRTPK